MAFLKATYMFNCTKKFRQKAPYLLNKNNTTQEKEKQRKTHFDEGKGAWVRRRIRCVLMMNKVHRGARVQVHKASIIYG